MVEMNNRLMLYIDILGFSNFVEEDKLNEKLDVYLQMFNQYKQSESFEEIEPSTPKWLVERLPPSRTFKFTFESIVVSDSILISCEEFMPPEFVNWGPEQFWEGTKKRDLKTFIGKANEIQSDILTNFGLLVRGIIHIGPLYHEGNLIVGKGFVEAVKLEKEKRYPAIYLSNGVCERWRQEIDTWRVHDKKGTRYRKDGEDFYLFPAQLCAKENKDVIDDIIEKGLNGAPDCKAREKWKWIKRERASYFGSNSLCNRIKNYFSFNN